MLKAPCKGTQGFQGEMEKNAGRTQIAAGLDHEIAPSLVCGSHIGLRFNMLLV